MKKILIVISILLLYSCKTVNLFEGEQNHSAFKHIDHNYQHVLAPDDKISISVWNHDDLSIGSSFSIYNTNESFGK